MEKNENKNENKNGKKMKTKLKLLVMALVAISMTGCFGTDSNDSSNNTNNDTNADTISNTDTDTDTDTDDNTVDPDVIEVVECSTPATATTESQKAKVYSFTSRTEGKTSESSVSYSGQVTRQVLLQEFINKIKGLANPGAVALTEADLLAYFDDRDETLQANIELLPGDFQLANDVVLISDLNGSKNILGKTSDASFIDNSVDFQGKTAISAVNSWITELVANSQTSKLGTKEVFLDSKNRDLSQLIDKVLLGAISYDQAANNYLADIGDNTAPQQKNDVDEAHTEAEHHWDEAFGYFGAARDYPSYSDDALAGKNGESPYKDSDGDSKIDLKSEYNFGISKNAGKRDRIGCQVNLTQDAFDGFYLGRKALSEGKSAESAEVQDAASAALIAWEKTIAATALHYVNDVLADQASFDADDQSEYSILDHAKHWSELKGFSIALQYNDSRIISAAELKKLHSYIGSAPVSAANNSDEAIKATQDLIAARELLGQVYGFSAYNVQNW